MEASVDRLLRGATTRESWKTADSLSGSRLERVTIAGVAHVVKYLCVDDDWIMRGTGDLHCHLLTLLASRVLERLPDAIDHTMVAYAQYISPAGHRSAAVLMRDVSDQLVPEGSAAIDLELHRAFLAHMAQMHAAYLDFEEGGTLFPPIHHYVFLTPLMGELEAASGRSDGVPAAVRVGWARMDEHYPRQARLLRELARDPSPLLHAMHAGPVTLVHGDWKLGNLGAHGGRTILLDWDRCGEGFPLVDLAWYLAVNCARLPEAKEDAIAAYRRSLENAGVDTSPWWKTQLTAALAGAFLQLGWAKTTEAAEFGWWADRLDEALPLL